MELLNTNGSLPLASHGGHAVHNVVSANDSNGLRWRLVPIDVLRDMLGLKDAAIRAKVASGELPRPVKFGSSRRAAARWVEHEIIQYIASKAAARQPEIQRKAAA